MKVKSDSGLLPGQPEAVIEQICFVGILYHFFGLFTKGHVSIYRRRRLFYFLLLRVTTYLPHDAAILLFSNCTFRPNAVGKKEAQVSNGPRTSTAAINVTVMSVQCSIRKRHGTMRSHVILYLI